MSQNLLDRLRGSRNSCHPGRLSGVNGKGLFFPFLTGRPLPSSTRGFADCIRGRKQSTQKLDRASYVYDGAASFRNSPDVELDERSTEIWRLGC